MSKILVDKEVVKHALEAAKRCDQIDGMYAWSDLIEALEQVLVQSEVELDEKELSENKKC